LLANDPSEYGSTAQQKIVTSILLHGSENPFLRESPKLQVFVFIVLWVLFGLLSVFWTSIAGCCQKNIEWESD